MSGSAACTSGSGNRTYRRQPGFVALALLGAMLAGCASTTGLREFRVYQSAFDKADAASAQILDELAVAEREAAQRLIAAGKDPVKVDPPTSRPSAQMLRSQGFDQSFYIVDSVYETDIGDPPGTAAIRRSLRAVADFNTIVLAYGEGRGLDELKASANLVATQATAAASAVALAAGTTLAIPALAPALGLVNEGMDVALQAASRAAFRDAVVARQPAVDQILVGVRDTAPEVFSLLTRNIATDAKNAWEDRRTADLQAAVAKLDGYRKLISNWVIMLEQTRQALALAVAAIEGPPDQVAALADVAQGAAELRDRSTRINRLLVELRRGTPPS